MSFKRPISFCVTWSDTWWPPLALLPDKDRASAPWLESSDSIKGGQEINTWAFSSFSALNSCPSWRFFSNVLMIIRGWNLSVSKCLYLGAKNAFVRGPRWARIRTHWPLAMSHTRALPSSEPVFLQRNGKICCWERDFKKNNHWPRLFFFSSPLSKWQPPVDTLRHVTAFSWPTNIFLDADSSTICSTLRGGSNKSSR